MPKHKPPYSYRHSFFSTIKHLRKVRRLGYKQFLYFLLNVNSLKKIILSKTKYNWFKKCLFFSDQLLPKILKFRGSSLRLVFLVKIVYNQFQFLKNYRLWYSIRSFVWFIITNLESIIFDWPTRHKTPIGVESAESL